MEYRPNSNPEGSERVRAETLAFFLTEHYVMNRAINQWEAPKYITYDRDDARLRSFYTNEWPHGLNPAPNAFSEAGLFFTGKKMYSLLLN